MIQVKVGERKASEIEAISEDRFIIDGNEVAFDIEPIGENKFHIIKDGKNFLAEMVDHDRVKKEMTVKINGKKALVTIKDHYDLLLESLGMSNGASKKIKELKAPMPGLVIEVMAKDKINIDKGGTLLILEAMKMENAIKSPDEVTVKEVHVKAGETVEKNQVLVTFE